MTKSPACVKKRTRIKKYLGWLLSRRTGEITCNARDHRRCTSSGGRLHETVVRDREIRNSYGCCVLVEPLNGCSELPACMSFGAPFRDEPRITEV